MERRFRSAYLTTLSVIGILPVLGLAVAAFVGSDDGTDVFSLVVAGPLLAMCVLFLVRQGAVVTEEEVQILRAFETRRIRRAELTDIYVFAAPRIGETTVELRLRDGSRFRSWWGWSRSSAERLGEYLGAEVVEESKPDRLTGGPKHYVCDRSQ